MHKSLAPALCRSAEKRLSAKVVADSAQLAKPRDSQQSAVARPKDI
jgi:hypothetical protein